MIGKKAIKYTINGIYGDVTNTDISLNNKVEDTYEKARHSYIERDIETFEDIEISGEIPGLPLSITMDEYFKIALIQAIEGIDVRNRDTANMIGYELKRLNGNIERLIREKDFEKIQEENTKE